jgi:hypothetical protein
MRLVLFHHIPYNIETSKQVLPIIRKLKVSEDGINSMVTRLRAERSGAEILTNPGEFSKTSELVLKPTRYPIQYIQRFFPMVKQAGG